MCDHHVDLAAVCADFGADPAPLLTGAELRPLIADGLVEQDGTRISVRRHARPLVRSIAAAFDAHLCSGNGQHSRAI